MNFLKKIGAMCLAVTFLLPTPVWAVDENPEEIQLSELGYEIINNDINGANGGIFDDLAYTGYPITVDGTEYSTGLGFHSTSMIEIQLNGQYSKFKTKAVISDQGGAGGQVQYEFFLDQQFTKEANFSGATLGGGHILETDVQPDAKSEIITRNGNPRIIEIEVDVTEAKTLSIYCNPLGSTNDDWAAFIDPVLVPASESEIKSLANLKSFSIDGQSKNAVINKEEKTVECYVPYGTDITALNVTAEVSNGATIEPGFDGSTDFTNPVQFDVISADGSTRNTWTATCIVGKMVPVIRSDNDYLEEIFNWAVEKTDKFVVTGTEQGKINYGDGGLYYGMNGTYGNPDTDEWCMPQDYEPSYWAGYFDRTAYYSRDFVHQSAGAHLVGLDTENFNMFHTFAENCKEYLGWYTPWAFNFDNSIYLMDYQETVHDGYDEDRFVREVAAQFELVEKAYEAFLWTGDRRYIEDEEMWNFYTNVMTKFVEEHDGLERNGGEKNGVAEGVGDIWQGVASYNERSIHPAEAGDSFASQYAATIAYAAMLKERGEEQASEEWYQKAADLKEYFNEEWSVVEGSDLYTWAIDENGTKHYLWTRDGAAGVNGAEPCWFMPMKGLTEPGERNDAYLQYIADRVADPATNMHNIEAYTYLPDTFFKYNWSDEAWKWMKYILDQRNNPHERPSQGTNGDYPEISFTTVSQVIEGMMGIEADAPQHRVVTAARLPEEIPNVAVDNIRMGSHILNVDHKNESETRIQNTSSDDLVWEARFYGHYAEIQDENGNILKANYKTVDGEEVTYVEITVPAGGSATAKAELEASVQTGDLERLVEEAKKLTADDYTSESWKAFAEALSYAENILINGEATQDDVDEAYLMLFEKRQALEKRDTTGGKEDSNTEEKDDTLQTGDEKSNAAKSPKTGDSEPIWVLLVTLCVSVTAVAVIVFERKKRHKE